MVNMKCITKKKRSVILLTSINQNMNSVMDLKKINMLLTEYSDK